MDNADSRQAEATFLRAPDIDPAKCDAYSGLGKLRLHEGRINASQLVPERAVAVDKDHPGARFDPVQATRVWPANAMHLRLQGWDEFAPRQKSNRVFC